ncbi:hypothetical protein C8Q80DRAFT_1105387 [Daedaleopsis nitida]|nr:hypothetical protein C8Q80DRAFT_1105387 [Daedaleopsis nitida]
MASSSSSRPLNRGAACLPCRKLKARCDGNKPACGRCNANNRPDDCEYATGAEVTRSRLLEENIALLEARIRELENPHEGAPSVQLHDPRRQATSSTRPSRMATPAATGPTGISLHPVSMAPPPGHVPDPTPQEIQMLVQTFMANASQLGFFLNPSRFRRGGHPANDALMNAVYLWGSRLSTTSTLRAREAAHANLATQALAGTTLSTQSHTVLTTIQAEILLANYFASTNRLLEGRYHCLAAVALVTASRYHQLDIGAMSGDPIGAGEKIRAFWTVVAIDRAWAAALHSPPSFGLCGRTKMQIMIPWPLSNEAYEQGLIAPQYGGNYCMEDFLRGAVNDSNEDFSPLAIRCKAGALYDRAIYVASQYRADMPNRNEYLTQFGALDGLIERFHGQLAAIRNRSFDDMRELLVCRTFACAAAIQLHAGFASHQPASWQKSVAVAIAAARAIDSVDLGQTRHLDPIMALLWSTIGKLLVNELRRMQQSGMPLRQGELTSVTSSLEKIVTAMSSLSASSQLMGTYLVCCQRLAEIQQARASMS